MSQFILPQSVHAILLANTVSLELFVSEMEPVLSAWSCMRTSQLLIETVIFFKSMVLIPFFSTGLFGNPDGS